MVDVTGLALIVLSLLVETTGALEPDSGFCIGNQCFTVFRKPGDFSAGQKHCTGLGGHLMTVRSSVSHDVLSILLGNFTGRYWIGLQHPTGCPDAAAELKGYHWVTKDSESDFSNWMPSFDSSCSSRRCVSVSPEDDFKWIQEACDDHGAGFLCEHSIKEPCKSLAAAEGESVIYTTPLGFKGDDLLSVPLGSTAIRMPSEAKYVCFSEQWLQAPWSCEIQEGGCEHKCTVDPKNVPTCYCPPGQVVHDTNKVTCEVAADDPCVNMGCMHACYKQGEAYACVCDQGFKLAQDGKSCVDFNDCKDERQCPGDNFKCINTVGGYQCVCEDGYKLSGDQCVDVDECVSAPCEHDCKNTPGSYKCECFKGYKEDPKDPHKCKLHCGKNECDAECDPNDHTLCYCPEGYIADERTGHTACVDIDECAFFYCDQGCKNTFGSYICSCSRGYTLVNQYKCVKTDDDTDYDGFEGSGAATSPPTVPPEISPNPTRRPSVVTMGGLVGIIVSTVICTLLVVFLGNHFLCGGKKTESDGAFKAVEGENHLHTSDV